MCTCTKLPQRKPRDSPSHLSKAHSSPHLSQMCSLCKKRTPACVAIMDQTQDGGIATGIAITSQCSAPVKPARPPRLPTGAPPVRTACRRERAARVPQLSQLRIQLLVVAFPVLSIVDPMHSDLAGGPAARTVEEPADLVRVRGHLPSEPGSSNLAPCSMD